MFLKKETFTRGMRRWHCSSYPACNVLSTEFIQKRTAKYDTDMDGTTEADKRVAYMQMALEINAWLVSRSLLNGDSSQDADTLYQSVQAKWSYEALDAGAESVLMLSGLSADKKDNASDSGNESEDMTPEKS